MRNLDEDGQEKIENERLELPPDLANGLIITLLKNVRRTQRCRPRFRSWPPPPSRDW